MVTRTVAASHCLKQLEEKVGAALYTRERPFETFMAIVGEMRTQNIVGTPNERRELRREIVRDAIGLRLHTHAGVRALIRQLAQERLCVEPRAAGVGGSAIGHPFGLGQSALAYQ